MHGNNRHNWGSISSIISLFTGHFSINFWFGSSPIILACTHLIILIIHPSYNSPSASLIVMYYLEMLLTVHLCTFCLLIIAYSLPPHPVWPHLLSYLFSSLTWLFLKLTLTLTFCICFFCMKHSSQRVFCFYIKHQPIRAAIPHYLWWSGGSQGSPSPAIHAFVWSSLLEGRIYDFKPIEMKIQNAESNITEYHFCNYIT